MQGERTVEQVNHTHAAKQKQNAARPKVRKLHQYWCCPAGVKRRNAEHYKQNTFLKNNFVA